MGKKVADLTLDDEHMTVGTDDSLQEAAKRLLSITGGIMVVLDEDQRAKGVIGQRQLIKALSEGVDASSAQCHQHMEMDFMQVALSDSTKGVLADIRSEVRRPLLPLTTKVNLSGISPPETTKKRFKWWPT